MILDDLELYKFEF